MRFRSMLEKLLGRGDGSPQEAVDIQNLLGGHVARLLDANPRWRSSETMRGILTGLLEGKYGAFIRAAVTDGVAESLAKKTHVCRRGSFSNVYLAVSSVPAVAPSSVRAFFPGGYGAFVTELLNASEYPRGSVSLVHWTYGSDGDRNCVHLTLFPAMNLVRDRAQGVGAVVAKDLYTEHELVELARGARSGTEEMTDDSEKEEAQSCARNDIFIPELSCTLSPAGSDRWRALLNMKLGDRAGAARLVMLEKRRRPSESIESAIQLAIDSLAEDIRRRR